MQRILSIGAVCFTLSAGPAESAANAQAAKPAPGKPSVESKASEICRQGRAQYASGDVLKAIKSLEKCVDHEPRNREAWVSLANASLEAGRFQASADAFARAEAIRPGDEAFLTNYLSALDGAGLTAQRIPVLRSMATLKHADAKAANALLAAVEAAGPEKHPEEYLMALQVIAEKPGADFYQVEKLAAAYLKRGQLEKAEAEYRGLLVKHPESGDLWAGLGAALAASDPQAASECYRKAAFYSNQADNRAAYAKEQQRLASTAKPEGKPALAEDPKEQAMLAVMAKPSASQAKPAPSEKPKPFDVKAYQDSVYKAELAKRMAALHLDKAPSAPAPAAAAPRAPVAAAVPTPSAPSASSKADADKAEKAAKENEKKAKEAEKKAKEDKQKQDDLARKAAEAEKERLAKVEKARQDSLLRVAELKSKEDKAKQDAAAKAEKARQDSLSKLAENKSKEDKAKAEALAKAEKAKQDSIARVVESKAKEDKAKQEALAKAEKARQDSVARVTEQKAKEDKAKQEALAKAEKAKQDSLVRVAELKAKADKARQDSLARVAEQKAKEDKAKQEAMAKAEKARQDSIARVAEQKAKEDKAKQEAFAKAEKAKQDSLVRVAELKAKADKARQDSLARVAEQKAKEDKAKQEAMAKAEKARQDSVARVAEQKAKEDKAKQEALAKAEKAKQDSLVRVAELKAKADKARQDSLVRVAEQKAKEDKAKQEAMAKAEKARQDSIARVAEQKAKEDKLKQEAMAKAEKARQDSIARVAEQKAKDEKARIVRETLSRERRERSDRAVALYREGRIDSSLILFKTVLADSPSTDAYYHAGRANLAKGEFSRSLDLFAKAPQDKPDLDGLKGKALMGLGKHKEALSALESQYAKSKDDSLLEDLAALKRKTGDEAGAIGYLEKLAEGHPGLEKIQEQLAAYYRAKGDKARATARYSRVFIVNPNHAEANYWLGMEAAHSGDAERAVPFLEKAVTLQPTRADAWKALAKADASLGRKDASWEAHRKAIALLPADLELAKGRLALARESHPADLPKAYEDVLRLSPADADAAMGLAKLRYAEGNWAAAEKNFRIACKDSKDSHAWSLFGRTLLELKKTDEASVAIQKAIDLGEKDPGLKLDLARIRMDKGDLDWAEALVKDLSKKSPSDPEPLYYLGLIALKRSQSAVAEEFFRKSHQLKADDGKYAEALGRLYRDKDDWKSAVSVLTQAEANLTLSGRLLYGDCLARGGDPVKAQAVYAELYKREATPALLARRMDLLVRVGKAEQAVELAAAAPFREATEVRFSLAKAQLSLADAHVLKGDVDQAVDLMKQVLKTDDHKPEYHYYLGLGYYGQGRYKKALGEFADALTYRVEYPEALYRKGLCLLKTEDIMEAEHAFGELSQHSEAGWKARGFYGLAMVFEAQGKPEAVQHHLERSVAAQPLPDALAYLSRSELKQAKVGEAQEMARKALALDPSHEGATVALAEALASGKKQSEAMELARQGLRAKPLSCGLMVQTAKLNFEAGKLDSTFAAGSNAIRICPEEPMGYYYAGVATRGSNRPKEAKQYFKSFKKFGGDKKLVPED
jgi:tetratricopeptide (TPR) repeat protein